MCLQRSPLQDGRPAFAAGADPARTSSEEIDLMCLTCGCMDAHREMGESNITYEDVERAAKENGNSVERTFETISSTLDKDRSDHPREYQSERPVA
jgi:hypothetical protein